MFYLCPYNLALKGVTIPYTDHNSLSSRLIALSNHSLHAIVQTRVDNPGIWNSETIVMVSFRKWLLWWNLISHKSDLLEY